MQGLGYGGGAGRAEHSKAPDQPNAISSLRSGMGRPLQFWLQLQPRRQSDPTLQRQAASTEVSADRPETSVAARPWSSPA